MYTLPNDFDAAIFVGRRVETLTFSENTINLDFGGDERLLVTTESGVTYEFRDSNDIPVTRQEKIRPPETSLVRLVGKKVVSAAVRDNVNLQLQFENDDIVWFDGRSQQYEMYRVFAGARELVV